jgi:hypothetical protein
LEGNPASGYVVINGVTTTKAIQVYSSSVGGTISQGFTLATYVPNEQKWYQTSGGSQVYLGNAVGIISGGGTGNANLFNRGVKSVYNYLSTPISAGARVIVAEYGSSYVVVSADC